ncbi:N-acetylmannosamine-6-phosphate 2-epimerase [Caldilinea sp.]|uniref:N-acetylmannosamine-6-phosphate 2-epimerase n=1 Tax=Caldilinea sp. TaxID=2293560 RepID=UPI002BFA2FC4|nr:N-acetylmannosamine-6-phosphate 2-epimerase [Anaerolineales bacterium]HQY93421.1 N-acetylmannosamine-6-phosphate 2-epimerase [Caldilinea sp.]HRA68821.1 N-acetylmannosamine-6-phosphate 2-epimerase [Caldilinea sp.]
MDTNRIDTERRRRLEALINQVRGRLIVSCQALPHEPLFGAEIMARLAVAAQQGGAAAIRANTPADIRAIRAAVDLPIVGLYKIDVPGYAVYITPTVVAACEVAAAGADMIAVDATARSRPEFDHLADFIAAVQAATGLPVLADISTYAEGMAAEAAGADCISTTMSGYTPDSVALEGPDIDLVAALARALKTPLLAEGRYYTPDQVLAALRAGATSVVVGGAITRPQEITKRFVRAVEKSENERLRD